MCTLNMLKMFGFFVCEKLQFLKLIINCNKLNEVLIVRLCTPVFFLSVEINVLLTILCILVYCMLTADEATF